MINYFAVPGIDQRTVKTFYKKKYSLDDLVTIAADKYGVSIAELKGKSRLQHIAAARQLYCYLAKQLTHKSLNQIGFPIEKDHATVIHSHRTVENLIFSGHKNGILAFNLLNTLSQ